MLHKNFLLLISLIVLASCTSKDDKEITTNMIENSASANGKIDIDKPEIKFDEEIFDFGKISQGEKVSHAFYFKNTGNKSLVITSASGSCGCTVPEWPKEPVLPGQNAKVNVIFNSEGKSGYQEKTITIVTNCEPATRIIKIKTEIIVPETAK
ncbi:MAG: DUF1573 domain-containing protein [Bacteroidetes bacterium]|nr:DUF1573 domain-containing protein [Bacteroidota bacterium]